MIFMAAFTGIGFTSENSSSISGSSRSCRSAAVSKSPSRAESARALVFSGSRLDRTEITPLPPSAMPAAAWSSFPLQTANLSGQAALIFGILEMSVAASLTPAIFGICARHCYTPTGISSPVLEGTLYMLTGICTAAAIVL